MRARARCHGGNRRLRRAMLAAATLTSAAALAAIAAGRHFCRKLLDPEIAPPEYEAKVLEVAPESDAAPRTVALERTEETLRQGVFGLEADSGGHAILGRIVSATDEVVTRVVTEVRGELRRGTRVHVNTIVWNGDPEQSLGMPFEEVRFETELGPMAAWHRPGRGDTWAVMVHGYKASRRGGFRDYPLLDDLGLPTLSVTYRNDPGNPGSPDGLIQLGAREWLDVEGALRWARDRGAARFVIFGDSMGGAVTCALYHRSELADRIDGLVLDAPVLDWRPVLALQARDRNLPGIVAASAGWWIRARIGLDFAAFDQIARAGAFEIPILLFHGTDDAVVPIETSERFAAARGDLITFFPADGAGHVQAWNVGPRIYEHRVRDFLTGVLGLGG